MAKQALVFFDGSKSVSAWDVDDTRGWVTVGDTELRGVDLFYSRVPWLYRGAMGRADDVGSMPFAIKSGKTDYDTSADYQDKLGILPNPGRLFRQVELSLTMTGKAFIFLETNRFGYVKSLKYCSPNSVFEIRDPSTNALTGYKRTVGTQTKDYLPSQFVVVTCPDYLTEDGAPKTSAATAALTSAGVLYNADRFIVSYFERGAIKATVLTVDGGTQSEADRLQSWWGDVVAGIKNAWSAVVLRMQAVKATVIGEGLESLQNNELTTERRQDIATALGVPESKMWSSAANYATRVEDERAYYKGTVIPECKTIADAFNEQLFIPAHKLDGYKLVFLTDTLEIFQENVSDQANAAGAFVTFLTNCPTPDIAKATAALVGFELDDAMISAIDKWYAEKQVRSEIIQQQMQPVAPDNQNQEEAQSPEEQAQPEPNVHEMRTILKTWERKARHALKNGRGANVEFETTILPRKICDAIRYELETCTTENDIKSAFASVDFPDPMYELKRANDLLESLSHV